MKAVSRDTAQVIVCTSFFRETGGGRRETWRAGMAQIRHFLPEIARLRGVVMPDDGLTHQLGRERGKDGNRVTQYDRAMHASARPGGAPYGGRGNPTSESGNRQ